MSVALTSFLFAIGVAGWTWSKIGRQTGGADHKSIALTAGAAGLAAFVFFFTLLKFVLKVG